MKLKTDKVSAFSVLIIQHLFELCQNTIISRSTPAATRRRARIEVASQNEAIGRVKEMGLFPTKIVEAEKGGGVDKAAGKKTKGAKPAAKGGSKKKGGGMNIEIKIPGLGGKVKPKVLTTFTRQLATLVDAGLPLLRGLRVLEKQERNVTLKRMLGELATVHRGRQHFFRGHWRSIRKSSTACSSTWSRPANWAACSKSS